MSWAGPRLSQSRSPANALARSLALHARSIALRAPWLDSWTSLHCMCAQALFINPI